MTSMLVEKAAVTVRYIKSSIYDAETKIEEI